MDYQAFKTRLKKGFDKGIYKIEGQKDGYNYFTELDLAIMFVTGCEFERGNNDLTLEDLMELIFVYCGQETFEKCFRDCV